MFKQTEAYIDEKCEEIGVTKVVIFSEEDVKDFADNNDYPRLGIMFQMEQAVEIKEGVINGLMVNKFSKTQSVGSSIDLIVAQILQIFEDLPLRDGSISFDSPIVDDSDVSGDLIFLQGFTVDIVA